MSTLSLSMTSQIEALDVGDAHVRADKVLIEDADEDTIKDTLAKVRNSSNQITNRLRKKHGRGYTVESVSMLAPDRKSILCLAITTRTEDEEEIDI